MHELTFWGILTYLILFSISIILVLPKKLNKFSLKHVIPVLFILLVSLYVLPLSLFNLHELNPTGNITPHLHSFANYIPNALVYSAVFIFIFSFFYRQLVLKRLNIVTIPDSILLSKCEKIIIVLFFIISFYLLYKLGKDVGGLFGLILSGYHVTELFINKGHYAVGFEWIITLTLLIFANILLKRDKLKLTYITLGILALSVSLTIMGRRAALVILLGSSVFLYHQLYHKIKLRNLLIIGIIGFYLLTLIGYIRGDSYENINSVIESIHERTNRLEDDDSFSFFYTITTGNFAVPFETFPQIIKSIGNEYPLGFGIYSFRSLSIIIPSVVWPDRPLPLSNWYMLKFYGNTKLNEGRQFFILTAPYMDFGPGGIIIFGLFLSLFWGKILTIGILHQNNALATTFVALILANSLNLISNDFFGWIIAFFKGYGLPIITIYVFRGLYEQIVKQRK